MDRQWTPITLYPHLFHASTDALVDYLVHLSTEHYLSRNEPQQDVDGTTVNAATKTTQQQITVLGIHSDFRPHS